MMTKTENLLVTVAEECAEISQAIDKSLRFGLNNHHPSTPQVKNKDDIMTEYYQLQAVVEELQKSGNLPVLKDDQIENIKKEKMEAVEKYQKVSVACGLMEE